MKFRRTVSSQSLSSLNPFFYIQPIMMKSPSFLLFFFFFTNMAVALSRTTAIHDDESTLTPTSIVFTTLGRSSYAFDVFSLPTATPLITPINEFQLTDGQSVNFNAQFPSSSVILPIITHTPPALHLIYVTERNGTSSIFLDALHNPEQHVGKRSILEESITRTQVCLVGCGPSNDGRVSMKDRPSLVGHDYLVYVSTHEDSGVARTSWTAVYSTQLSTGLTKRLTPFGVADYSPAVSPSGIWTAVASYGEKGWDGEVEELGADIYVFLTQDGSNRVKVVEHGGWPSWADELTFYFHRRGEDGWWKVYRAILPENGQFSVDSVVTQRVTPPGIHSFTPAASVSDKTFIAVATRRPDSEFRHIELFDVVSKSFKAVTRLVSPRAHHLNPFVSPDSSRVGYHRCRGVGNNERGSPDLFLENRESPKPGLSLLRIDGSFPSFSPDGSRIAYVKLPGLYVVNSDGSGHREVSSRTAFSTAWDPKRKGVVYTSVGPTFASESTNVDIISVNVDESSSSYKKLTIGGENNAFPSPSPDGKWIVFRSGRMGHKNLYIMDSVDGEMGFLSRLTEGPWTDTMCNWSPDGNWIAFASDQNNPGSGSFGLFKIHPNGTGLTKLVQSGSGGRANHPWFSPDGKDIVFTSDYAAVSAEPISNPHHFQPYGEIFTMRSDGSDLHRLTHNSFEDGTPSWGPKFMKPVDVEWPAGGPKCSFEDCHWLNASPKSNHVSSTTKTQCAEFSKPASCGHY